MQIMQRIQQIWADKLLHYSILGATLVLLVTGGLVAVYVIRNANADKTAQTADQSDQLQGTEEPYSVENEASWMPTGGSGSPAELAAVFRDFILLSDKKIKLLTPPFASVKGLLNEQLITQVVEAVAGSQEKLDSGVWYTIGTDNVRIADDWIAISVRAVKVEKFQEEIPSSAPEKIFYLIGNRSSAKDDWRLASKESEAGAELVCSSPDSFIAPELKYLDTVNYGACGWESWSEAKTGVKFDGEHYEVYTGENGHYIADMYSSDEKDALKEAAIRVWGKPQPDKYIVSITLGSVGHFDEWEKTNIVLYYPGYSPIEDVKLAFIVHTPNGTKAVIQGEKYADAFAVLQYIPNFDEAYFKTLFID